ncbi:PTS system mannose/fructose/sorbose family transporter subunit IID [Aerococcus urinae]|uniref:PTS system mannose/fructose/sorbose family transporter subunit IID n=1 Tax=Aerococcus urinae TaxID=1376 RepID=A0ABT4C3A3_9LACT|nr:PTS system mannose/fructose/sorbose family transporter subunit IID [Aerococcus urinae]MCY3032185.1 PTS system mannose/fructose/sorbose family transporter subunit IID [Aerococcus urinae]MCY3037691.1 PTS system mannose/fructose/sorbose family transporter subunit IID [Aerococcus urinae]MCY3044231.1 PTS system mannose/fructose/sorbose family transporter subunit IID [Aerococcus urinae]MCY3045644.1 PTS system mannose/fructose/sorbose family transporter subunit IID [Aerococcus urinae]MCY3047686.1 
MEQNNGNPIITKKEKRKMFIRANVYNGAFNFERGQNLGVAYVMNPVIDKLYKDKDKKIEALQRHLEWYNNHPWLSGIVFGITAAKEEKKAQSDNLEGSSIIAMKIGLMGPLAGIGDPLFWGTLRPVLASIGASLAMVGNIFGPILFFVGINIIRLATIHYGMEFGYARGADIVDDLTGSQINKITEAAQIVGLFVMGALVNTWTNINIPIVATKIIDSNGIETIQTVQDVLDSILPGMLALGLTLIVSWLLKKGVNPLLIIVSIFVIGIIGRYFNLLG